MNIVSKRSLLTTSLLGLVLGYILINPLVFGICAVSYVLNGHVYCQDVWEYTVAKLLFSTFIPLLPFSLITYRMRDKVFQAWWRFAWWFVPMILAVSFLGNFEPSSGGGFGVPSFSLSFLILLILYPVFILVSIIKIVRAYRIRR